MTPRVFLIAFIAAIVPLGGPVAAQSDARGLGEAELAKIDLEQARIVQSGEVEPMRALLHPQYTAHLTNGQLAGYDQTLSMVAKGQLAREKFKRFQEKVLLAGDTGAVMGKDVLDDPPPLARNGEKTRRYTNIYVKQDGRWRLFARHFHLLP